ncbi:hypothetical protein Tco_1192029 [Tanacetum coccineum]
MSHNLRSTLNKKKKSESWGSSVAKIPLKFKIKKKQTDLETPIPTAKHIDINNIIGAQQLSYTLAKRDDDIADEFVDIVLLSQEDLDTRIDPWSDKERPDENVEVALIQKKGKSVMEASDTPITTLTRSLGLVYLRRKKNSRN